MDQTLKPSRFSETEDSKDMTGNMEYDQLVQMYTLQYMQTLKQQGYYHLVQHGITRAHLPRSTVPSAVPLSGGLLPYSVRQAYIPALNGAHVIYRPPLLQAAGLEDHGNGVADEYDPAEPTDDSSKNATKRDRPGSPHGSDGHTHSPWMDQGELKVTLYDDRRAVSQDGPTQPKRRKFGPTPGSMHPHDHPHGHMMMSSPPENPPGQDSHLPGQEPGMLPPGYLPPYHPNNYQEMQRIKAHEHLRKIEQSYEKESFCNICDRPFSGPLIQHRQTEEHKRKLRLTTRGCRLCRTGSFTKYPDYVKHIDSEAHKKRKEELHRHVQQARPDRDEDEEHPHDDHHDNEDMHYPEDMVTVDATGIYETDQSKQDGSLNAHASPRMPNQHMSSIRTPNHLDVSPVHQPPSPAVPSNSPDQSTPIPQASTSRSQSGHTTHRNDPPPMLSYSPITVAPSPADSFDESQDFTNIKTEPLDGAPSYQNDNPMPIGQEYIVPKTGFFCRLCQKFYFKKEVAMNNHCASRTHFDNYMNANRAKLEVDDESMQNTDASFMPR